jgi:hypothetical protein
MARKVLGRGENGMAVDCRLKINTRTKGIWCEPDGIPLLWLPHDKSWIPDLPKGSDNYWFGPIWDTPIRLQNHRNDPRNLSTANPLVINQAAARLTSPRRHALACEIEEHKQVHREETKSQKELGFCSWQNETKQNTPLEEGVVAG